MFKIWLIALCCAALGPTTARSTSKFDAEARAMVEKFTTEQVLGQITQVNIVKLLNPDNTLNETSVRNHAKMKVGPYLSSPFADGPNNITGEVGWSLSHWRELLTRIQENAMEEPDGIPMIFGLDSVHGSGFVQNSTLFGAQLNAAATFNPELVYEMGRITGQDTQAAGVPWVFGPILEIASNPMWPRTYETFGEDPHLVSVMADAIICGLQSNNQTAACMKHFVGYSKTPTGHDKDGVMISDFDLLNYFVPPFQAAINAGVLSAMENYLSIIGVPTIGNHKILQQLLCEDLAFDGMITSDYAEAGSLSKFHEIARTVDEAVGFSYTWTGIDMNMGNTLAYLNGTKRRVQSTSIA